MSTTLDHTQTREYKKAYKHHLKTRQALPSEDLTAFRAQERVYKSKFPPPSLEHVLDVWALDPDLSGNAGLGGTWTRGGNACDAEAVPISLNDSPRRAYVVRSHPGLVIIPNFLSAADQRALIRSSLATQARPPNETNLDVHWLVPENGIWQAWIDERNNSDGSNIIPRAQALPGSGFRADPPTKRTLIENTPGELVTPNTSPLPSPAPSSSLTPLSPTQLLLKLRWANIGRSYHWGSKAYDFSKELAPFPSDVRDVCKRAVGMIPWDEVWKGYDGWDSGEWGSEEHWRDWPETFEPDAGIVNFYQTRDTLMGHVDRSEVSSTTPLVSISLGNAAIFLIGGKDRSIQPIPILLRSGDVVIMSGPRCRRAFHGVPRILEGTLPSHLSPGDAEDSADWLPFGEYMRNTRVNINVRQVFPTGWTPPAPAREPLGR